MILAEIFIYVHFISYDSSEETFVSCLIYSLIIIRHVSFSFFLYLATLSVWRLYDVGYMKTINEYGALSGKKVGKENLSTRRKQLCPLQILHYDLGLKPDYSEAKAGE
jgi:hypothetical protein